VNEVKRMLAA